MNGLRSHSKMQSFGDRHKIPQLVQIHFVFPEFRSTLSSIACLFAPYRFRFTFFLRDAISTASHNVHTNSSNASEMNRQAGCDALAWSCFRPPDKGAVSAQHIPSKLLTTDCQPPTVNRHLHSNNPTLLISWIRSIRNCFHTLLSGHEEFNDGLCP